MLNRIPRALALALLAALPAVLPAARAGADTLLTLKSHTDTPAMLGQNVSGSDKTVTIWVGPNRVRRDDGNASSILLFDQKKLYIVDHQDKSYTAIDLPVNFAKLLPGEQGEALYKEMSATAKMDAKITKTGETKKIGAWNAQKYHVELSNPTIKVVKMQQIDGFPVRQESTISYGAPKDTKSVEELVSVQKKDPPANTFAPPAGYTQKPFANPAAQVPGAKPVTKQ